PDQALSSNNSQGVPTCFNVSQPWSGSLDTFSTPVECGPLMVSIWRSILNAFSSLLVKCPTQPTIPHINHLSINSYKSKYQRVIFRRSSVRYFDVLNLWFTLVNPKFSRKTTAQG